VAALAAVEVMVAAMLLLTTLELDTSPQTEQEVAMGLGLAQLSLVEVDLLKIVS
jgi:hypothetical protein